MTFKLPKSFFKPTRLKAKIFLLFMLPSSFSFVANLPFPLFHNDLATTILHPLLAIFIPLNLTLFAPVLMIVGLILGMFSPDGYSASTNAFLFESLLAFLLSLLYGYLLTCLLIPLLAFIQRMASQKRIVFLLLLSLLLILSYLAFFLPTLFFLTLPLIAVLVALSLYFIRRQKSLLLAFLFLVGIMLSSMWVISYDMLQDIVCIRTPAPFQEENTTEVVVDEAQFPGETTNSVFTCFENFTLFPALTEELSKMLR